MAQLAETARQIGRVYGLLAAAFVLFLVAARTVGADEATREERAAAARA